jgi:S-adenosylmethionine decarboxylase
MQVGTEWLIDAAGCSPEVLRDPSALRSLCERILADLELHLVGAGTWHQFPPPGGGLTGLYLLTESHLACHTYPEHGVATFNLHCCRKRPRWCWETALQQILGATDVTVREISRGGSA